VGKDFGSDLDPLASKQPMETGHEKATRLLRPLLRRFTVCFLGKFQCCPRDVWVDPYARRGKACAGNRVAA